MRRSLLGLGFCCGLQLSLGGCVTSQGTGVITTPAPKLLPAVSYLLAESRQAIKAGRMEAARASAERAYALQSQAVEVLALMAELAERELEAEDCYAFAQKALDQLAAPESELGIRLQRQSERCAKKIR